MQMTPVNSSALAAIGYDANTRRLRIRFQSGSTNYDFAEVPPHIYTNLLRATSKGMYYDTFIRGRYRTS